MTTFSTIVLRTIAVIFILWGLSYIYNDSIGIDAAPFNRLLAVGDSTGSGPIVPVCSSYTTCNEHGHCSENPSKVGVCDCDNGWTTYGSSQCTYKQKFQLTAFLLQFFISGAGYIYVGSTAMGVGELILSVFVWIFLIGSGIYFIKSDGGEDGTICLYCLGIVCAIASFGWWLATVIMFGMNDVNDSNGINLKGW